LIIASCMTILTWDGRMSAGERKFCRRMIEGCRTPGIHRVAGRTLRRESASYVTRIRCVVKITLVAIDAVLMQPCKGIVNMTACTWHCRVCTGKWKGSIRMIEDRWRPSAGGMALIACLCKMSCSMIRIGRLRIIVLMTLITRGIDELIVAVRMAVLAKKCHMLPAEQELRGGMIECRRDPGVHGMTGGTSGRKITGNMIRVRRFVEITLVAIDTVLMQSGIEIIDMTPYAWSGEMCTDERKRGSGMIECRWYPDAGGMTGRTVMIKVSC
jgi:hypothetical protein